MSTFERAARALRRGSTARIRRGARGRRVRRVPRPCVLAAALAPIACGGDATDPGADVEGTYALVSVNGEAPPAVVLDTIQDDNHIVATLTDGELVLDDGTYRSELSVRATLDGDPLHLDPVRDSGRYEVDGATVRFLSEAGEPKGTATRDGDEVATSETHPDYGTLELVFRR